MTPLDRGAGFAPSPQAIAIVRERLQEMGLPLSESAARGLLDAVLAVEGPRLYSQLRGTFENSLEIIRDTAEAALGGAKNPPLGEGRRAERSDLLGGGRRLSALRHPTEMPDQEFEDDPRPVFKRPRR
jgi:hypothetical protein